ncbi:unnamed protein product [Clonostachys chloroleuca]|uniref:Uncharacterized protein n=1 Tax=Clonostachys chloroleuca TaxID=1926264 RepID=A0AA35QFD3_9HYPO|nr:unnamed protein product [Clonostachys chloroleuca]
MLDKEMEKCGLGSLLTNVAGLLRSASDERENPPGSQAPDKAGFPLSISASLHFPAGFNPPLAPLHLTSITFCQAFGRQAIRNSIAHNAATSSDQEALARELSVQPANVNAGHSLLLLSQCKAKV